MELLGAVSSSASVGFVPFTVRPAAVPATPICLEALQRTSATGKPRGNRRGIRRIPGHAIDMIDRAAGHAGTTRSGFLTRAALTVIEQNIKLA